MPLIILTGYPCSGLTYRANQLASLLETTQNDLFASGAVPSTKPRYKIHVVSTHDESHPRTLYDTARTEKQARGVAYTRAKRALGRDSFVILDGMNYIKGYRYQLWCEAKALGTSCCVVHVGTPIDQCVANNEARLKRKGSQSQQSQSTTTAVEEETKPAANDDSNSNPEPPKETTDIEEPYPPELLTNLIFRYEEPSMHSRWDKPLFTVPWSDPSPPIAEIWTALTGIPHPSTNLATEEDQDNISQLSASLTSTQLSSAPSIAGSIATSATRGPRATALRRTKIQPHLATVLPAATDSSALYNMEKRTSAIVSAIRAFTLANPSAKATLAQSTDAVGIRIPVPEAETEIIIPVHIASASTTDDLSGPGGVLALPRLQRLRRQWIALNRAYIGGPHASNKGGLGDDQIADAFVRFLNADFADEVDES